MNTFRRRQSILQWLRNSAIACATLLPTATSVRSNTLLSQDERRSGETVSNKVDVSGPQFECERLPRIDDSFSPPSVAPDFLGTDSGSTAQAARPSASGGYSWRARPFSGGYQAGLIYNHLPTNHLDDAAGLLLTKRYGWDFADRWGLEARIAEGWLRDASVIDAAQRRSQRATFGDLSLLFYPWPESRLRPYVTMGAGAADFHFTDSDGQTVDQVLATMPLGMGVKYPINDWLVIRGEVLDNLAFGDDDLPLANNLSFNSGVEVRFGDLRKHLWPWGR